MDALYIISNIDYCYEYVVNQIPVDLLLYAHIPPALAAIIFGFYLIYRNRSVASFSLFYVCLGFGAWSFLNLLTWFVFIGAADTMFAWSLIDLVGLVFFFFSYRFLYSFITEKDIPVWQMVAGIVLITPTLISTLLGLNLSGFDANVCESIENNSVVAFTYGAQLLFIIATLCLGATSYRNIHDQLKRRTALLATTGVTIFLTFFFLVNFLVLILVNTAAVDYAYNFGIYGLFGMPVLLILLGYLIVRYKAFNIQLLGAQMIIVALFALVASQIFFYSSRAELVVNLATIVFVLIFGYLLVRSVQAEVRQREEIERLAVNLENANMRLKELDKMKSEFVSIASHQLRSPLTSIRGYVSMLMEGSYGVIPDSARQVLEKIAESGKFMALSIEEYLNVSRIEAGNMKYEYSDFDMEQIARSVTDELRPLAEKKGLSLSYESQTSGKTLVHADIGKVRQIIANLLDNSIKYTQKGSVAVIAKNDTEGTKMLVMIKDTGVGMSKEAIGTLFEKFVRAKNANTVNVTGTGLGLYVAKTMITKMGGRIVAESEGEGRGSTFTIELPLVA